MAKRAARRAKLHAIDNDRIHNLVFDHPPANDRDQSYIRKVRPRSDNQRLLMEAAGRAAQVAQPRSRQQCRGTRLGLRGLPPRPAREAGRGVCRVGEYTRRVVSAPAARTVGPFGR